MVPTFRFVKYLAAAAWLAPLFAQQPAYQNPAVPLEKRVDDLLGRLTLEEKVSQLMNDSAAVDRLGIPAYNWWNECLHGVARAGRATVFPETIGLAATWDTELVFRVSTAISDEARAKHHEAVRRGQRNIYQGLTFWTPNINLFRDPRWGRGMETYGEDPYLTGSMAAKFIRGLQGDDPKYLKTVATPKHYAVHSGPESERHTFDAAIDDRELFDSYLPHFETAVKEGGALSVMCSYNSVDGQPACANPRLLTQILRKQWGFQGYVVSDCGAIGDIYQSHKFAGTAPEGVARALQAGTDLDCGVEYRNLLPAVRAGLVSESEIDKSVRRLLTIRFRLGMFDPPAMVKYARIPYSANDSPEHRQLALEAARKSIVLLKNEGHALPLAKSLKTIAVIGPNADDEDVLLGNYNGQPSAPVTPLEGIRRKIGATAKVLYARGSGLATGMPAFETIPSSALFASDAARSARGLKAEYYASADFDGTQRRARTQTWPAEEQTQGPVPKNPQPLFTRTDSQVDFNWWDKAPRADMNGDEFGVRWTGFLRAPASGAYQFGAFGRNGFSVYLDGKPVAAHNSIHESAYAYGEVQLEAGKLYAIRLDFHKYLGDARIRLLWSRPASAAERDAALRAAGQADAVVLVLGLSPRLEGEEMRVPVEGFRGGDRVDIGLPAAQQKLMEDIVALGKPVVLVLLNGSALAVTWARDHVPAIVEAWYPGEAGGDAIADVLFGDTNPAGRLPVTFYRSADQLPAFTDYRMAGRTYRYFTGEPLYPFGYGLSYSSFAYRNLRLPAEAKAGAPVAVSVEVQNTGQMAGEEVVQLYVKHIGAAVPSPLISLEGFARVSLQPGETRVVDFALAPRQLATVQADGHRLAEPGTVVISVGGAQPGFTGPLQPSTTGVVTGSLPVTGEAKAVE
ncbi:MAG: glycoside hydrolase family 3 C-terminal domain-containing protein [Bryobacteraceae bacterium]